MATPTATLWEIDPHTTAKRENLQRPLKAWFPILGSRHPQYCLERRLRRARPVQRSELGSPIIALNVAANHRKTLGGELVFWFIDERKDRSDHLKRELNGEPSLQGLRRGVLQNLPALGNRVAQLVADSLIHRSLQRNRCP
jgi:hypothetical protein